MRQVICHYHIFKNSGSSFDDLLKENYGNLHTTFDGPFPYISFDQDQLLNIVRRNKNTVAFSSHQIGLPVPVSLEIEFLPVVFIRHPLLRIASIYRYKKKVNDGTEISKCAQGRTFEKWIQCCFDSQTLISHVSNVQTRFLGGVYKQNSLKIRRGKKMEYDLVQASRNIETVKLIARTEFFNDDVADFTSILEEWGISFKFTSGIVKNTTSSDHNLPMEDRVSTLLSGLSPSLQDLLLSANNQDFELYTLATKQIQQRKEFTKNA